MWLLPLSSYVIGVCMGLNVTADGGIHNTAAKSFKKVGFQSVKIIDSKNLWQLVTHPTPRFFAIIVPNSHVWCFLKKLNVDLSLIKGYHI